MGASERLKALIKEFEGLHDGDKKALHLQPEKDPVGIWTIGWGHAIRMGNRNLRDDVDKALAYKLFPALTLAEAETLLEKDLEYYQNIVNKLVKVKLNQNQKDALTSFAYNLGGANLASSTLLKKLNVNPLDKTLGAEFEKWRFSGKTPLPGLLRRRTLEYKLYTA